jgi:hypothetical protein
MQDGSVEAVYAFAPMIGRASRGRSGETFDADGMVRDVFVQVRKNEKEFEHAIALVWIRVAGAFFEVFHDSEGVSEEPFEAFRVHRAARATALKGLVSANECFVEEMVEAELLAGKGPRNRLGTRLPSARDRNRRVHYTPQSAIERPSLEAVGRD